MAALRRRRALTREQEAALRASLQRMAEDPDYQTEASAIEAEFARASWEALQQAEAAE